MEVSREGNAECTGAVEAAHRLALVLAVDVLALDRHLEACGGFMAGETIVSTICNAGVDVHFNYTYVTI
jgi:hypothetical protein